MTVALVCPWSSGGKTDVQTQKVIPPACAGQTWADKASFVEHLVAEHGGPRGWTRISAEREAEQQWLAREQAEIDATQGPDPDPCGDTFEFTTVEGDSLELECQLPVHAGDHRTTIANGRRIVTISWTPEEETLTLLERL